MKLSIIGLTIAVVLGSPKIEFSPLTDFSIFDASNFLIFWIMVKLIVWAEVSVPKLVTQVQKNLSAAL